MSPAFYTPRTFAAATPAIMTTVELPYSPEVLALWNEKDEEASEKWRQEKIKDFEASGATKDKRVTRVETEPRYGLGASAAGPTRRIGRGWPRLRVA